MKILKQEYDKYTEEDFLVWKLLFERQMKNLEGRISDEYLKALGTIGFRADRIPDFNEVRAALAPLTGWELQAVESLVPQNEFFHALRAKRFTATTWLRKLSQLDYIEEPDMFHDVFGHAPLLANKNYTDFFKGIAEIALQHMNNPNAIELLGRLYWFTIEFGLIMENNQLKIYGAGIISSFGETNHCFSSSVKRVPFNVKAILATPYRNDQIQNLYFVIDSFGQLYDSLGEVDQTLKCAANSTWTHFANTPGH